MYLEALSPQPSSQIVIFCLSYSHIFMLGAEILVTMKYPEIKHRS